MQYIIGILFIISLTVIAVAKIVYQNSPRVTWDDLEEKFGFVYRDDQKGIICLDCGHVSYHPRDVKERYCGFCDKFHENKSNHENDVDFQ